MRKLRDSLIIPAVLAFTCALCALPMHAADIPYLGSRLEEVIREEMQEWGVAGVAVALIDDQEVVFAEGYGEARRDSVFRCGSISKLFNALAVMQQVEAGKLDLDTPLQQHGSDLLPLNPFPGTPAVTLRQILCHRSGLQRESPLGGYLDGSHPTLEATVASIRSCVLATKPGEKRRYSNIAPSLAGLIVERITKRSFEEYQKTRIIEPLGMRHSVWTLRRVRKDTLIVGHMRVADGDGGWVRRDAPVFDLGTIPAGNLYSTAEDLGHFVSALLANGKGLVTPDTLKEMWRPQFTTDETGFGLGFMVGKFRTHRSISHSGSVYGHSSSLVLLPEAKVGVVVLANEDIVNGRVGRISNFALSLLLEGKLGEKPKDAAEAPLTAPVELAPFVGSYESQSYWAELRTDGRKLVGNVSGQETRFERVGSLEFVANSRIEDRTPVTFERNPAGTIQAFSLGAQRFTRVTSKDDLPADWKAVLGRYGPEFAPVIITERYGHLYAMTENMVDYRLTPVNRHLCALPPGMYVDEFVVFLPGPREMPAAIDFANMLLPRRAAIKR